MSDEKPTNNKKNSKWVSKSETFITGLLSYTVQIKVSTIVLIIISGIGIVIYLAAYSEKPCFGVNFSTDGVQYLCSLLTFWAFLITLYKQLELSSKLKTHNKAILITNNKNCSGLIDDIIVIANSPENNYFSMNVIRERIEVFLEYCQNACSDDDAEEYRKFSVELAVYETKLRSAIKNTKNAFEPSEFLETLREIKRFLIRRDQINTNY